MRLVPMSEGKFRRGAFACEKSASRDYPGLLSINGDPGSFNLHFGAISPKATYGSEP